MPPPKHPEPRPAPDGTLHSVATTLDQELTRLARAAGLAVAARRARLFVLGGLVLLTLIVLAHRLVGDVPLVDRVEGRPIYALGAVIGAGLLAWALGRAAGLFARPPRRELARRLDDELSLADVADAALSAGRPVNAGTGVSESDASPVAQSVARRAAAQLGAVDTKRFGKVTGPGRRIPILLLAITLFLLLAPGVLGLGGSSGPGAGQEAGIGRKDEPEEPRKGDALTPEEADRWLVQHAKLILDVPDPKKPLEWKVRLSTDVAPPAALDGTLAAIVDQKAPTPTGQSIGASIGIAANVVRDFDVEKVKAVDAQLTPGKHLVALQWTPSTLPFRASLLSNEVEIDVPPPQPSPSASNPDEQKDPQPNPIPPEPPPPLPPPPPPPPPPQPEPHPPGDGTPVPQPPEVVFHDEVVEPLAKDGERVKKDKAVVAVKDPEAGNAPPRLVPVDEVLADVPRVVERAVAQERVSPSDRGFLVRYLEALRKASGGR